MPRNTTRRYVTDYEIAIWATKGIGWTFNKPCSKPYLRPSFEYPVVPKSKDKIHPTQKSLYLLDEIIKIHTNPGDCIFDPFCGSGTTGVAAVRNNRFFVGCEIDKNYYKKSFERIRNEYYNLINSSNDFVTRSPLYYLGDKYKLWRELSTLFPKNINNFYDVFGGGGTMISNVEAKNYFYNDKDSNLVKILQFMNSNPLSEILLSLYWRL
ncbi:DNA methyltransferase [Mycoplasmopsis caviae]|uniref:Methyltransferase n=1 Tax=Mycoplasmopsis caviae TaxID=55603 RepID=A0A3P8KM90_9BACT|nr:DNA methyltransferase [Mycoplasmopsis caviae]UUD35313.1 DNA methyltransferase [Mycoplasmopsis caviae]VDR41908.1 Modification methylase HpaI [Mycoplasmopsis caviae]